ncbi:DNA adenine methylase [candidate division KSB1 bacterium]|nr:DNA adenine methylase [candidate division KSB1 bacterium]
MEVLFKDEILEKSISDFPQTRYQGSKFKLLSWIWDNISFLDFENVADLFGGTGAVSYLFKTQGKAVTFNDILKSNFNSGIALIENGEKKINSRDIQNVLNRRSEDSKRIISEHFKGIYYTDTENAWLDQVIQNIFFYFEDDYYKKSLLLWALFQACIIKRPFNLFHRKNLYLRLQEVKRSFGNKTTWDKPFEDYFLRFIRQANQAVFDNGKRCHAIHQDALELKNDFDLVYIDTPYISAKGIGVDYFHFYHFLEGLCDYDNWEQYIDYTKKHHPLKLKANRWIDKNRISMAFFELIEHFRKSQLVISYRSDGIPSIDQLQTILKKFKKNCKIEVCQNYQYVLSTNHDSHELLLVGWD